MTVNDQYEHDATDDTNQTPLMTDSNQVQDTLL